MSKLWSNVATVWPMLGVVLLALVLRLWALNWGLPYLYHNDESIFVVIIQNIVKTGDLNPHYFDYGSAFFYINALAYLPYYLVGKAIGAFHSLNDIPYPNQLAMGVGITPMESTYLLGRSVTMLFGIAAVILVFFIGKRVSGKALVGLIAAFMMAVSPTCVSLSRTITPNMFLVFFILLTVWGAIRIYEENSTGAYIVAGIAAGLAISTKYNGAMVLGVILLACVMKSGWAALKNPRLYLAFGLAALTFLVSTPFALLDYPTFIKDVTKDAIHYSSGHYGMEGDTVQWYLNYLWTQEGPVVVLGLLGALFALISRSKPLLILVSFPVVYSVFISLFVVRNDRTILPILPFVFILAANLLVYVGEWLIARGAERRGVLVSGILVVAILAVGPLSMTANAAAQEVTPDSRLTGVEWIKEHIEPGAKVGIEVGSPYLDPQVYSVQPVGAIIAHTPDWYVHEQYDYLVFAWNMYGRFYREPEKYANQISQYEAFFGKFQLVKQLDDGGYQVKIYKVPHETQK